MQQGKVKFELERGGELSEIARLFHDLEAAYYALIRLPNRRDRRRYERRFLMPFDLMPVDYFESFGIRSLLPGDTPELSRIEINSPGWAEIIGALNPLQQMREYLKDRHERKKDKAWRSETEKNKAVLENELIRAQPGREKVGAIKDFYDLLEEIDIPEDEKQRILWSRLGEPLLNLGKHQDSGLLGDQTGHDDQAKD